MEKINENDIVIICGETGKYYLKIKNIFLRLFPGTGVNQMTVKIKHKAFIG